MERASLSPGFRFRPTDVELVMYYLKKKVLGNKICGEAIGELNIYEFDPWDLPDKSCSKNKDFQWYFFCPRRKKYASGSRTNRATQTGYWKSTGKERFVIYHQMTVGTVKTLVFHIGHAPLGKKINWIIHEYRLEDEKLANGGVVQDTYVLCKVFQKSALGPNNSAQYGAPFNEEDWNDEAESLPSDKPTSVLESIITWSCCELSSSSTVPFCNKESSEVNDYDKEICAESFSSDGATILQLENQNNSIVTSTIVPEGAYNWSYPETGLSSIVPSSNVQDDDFASLLATFNEDNSPIENDNYILSYSQMGSSSAMPPSNF